LSSLWRTGSSSYSGTEHSTWEGTGWVSVVVQTQEHPWAKVVLSSEQSRAACSCDLQDT
jgi:hypothetical protein